jgi:CRISPR-associated protein Cmr1
MGTRCRRFFMTGVNKREYVFTAISDVWTGDADGKGKRLITTGLLGSIRWWFEVVVRGLGGFACDPSNSGFRCPDQSGRRCIVCELFGCTGWARKFGFEVVDKDGKARQEAIKAEGTFGVRFVELRPVRDEEWVLLELTLRLISDYAAIGGKTVYKPTLEKGREKSCHHRDYGVVKMLDESVMKIGRQRLTSYVSQRQWRQGGHDRFSWASLNNFWCVKGRYLARISVNESTFNRVLRRREAKKQAGQLVAPDPISKWLAGDKRQSKKVFSFEADGGRTFGFVKPGLIDFEQMKERLRGAWRDLQDHELITGRQIIDRLMREDAGASET